MTSNCFKNQEKDKSKSTKRSLDQAQTQQPNKKQRTGELPAGQISPTNSSSQFFTETKKTIPKKEKKHKTLLGELFDDDSASDQENEGTKSPTTH